MSSAIDLQTKLRKRLEALLKLPENQVCCDCNRRGPRWASANLGNFFCIECSGIHRNLGVHISFVRSINLDSWTVKQVEFMEEWGNARANAYWEANVPAAVRKPKEGDGVRTVEKYIRDKYEHKRYVANSIPSKKSDIVNSDVKVHRAVAVATEPAIVNIQPVPLAVIQSTPVVVVQTELIDFFNEPYPATTTIIASRNELDNSATVFDPFAAPTTDFTEFQVAQSSPNKPAPVSFPSNFGLPNPQNPQEQLIPPKPVKPQASADAILSLYNPSVPHASLNQQGGGMIPSNGLSGFQPSYAYSQQQIQLPQQMQYPQQQRQFAPQQLQQYPQQQQYQQPQQMQYHQQQVHFQPHQQQYQQQQPQYQQQQSQYQQQQSQSHFPQNYAQQGNGWR